MNTYLSLTSTLVSSRAVSNIRTHVLGRKEKDIEVRLLRYPSSWPVHECIWELLIVGFPAESMHYR